jgi:hypothetical protein
MTAINVTQEIAATVAAVSVAVAAVLGMVQIIEKTSNFRLNRRKLAAEVEKLERDNAEAVKRMGLRRHFDDSEVTRTRLRYREAQVILDQVGNRLENSSVRAKEIEVEIIVRPNLKDEQDK